MGGLYIMSLLFQRLDIALFQGHQGYGSGSLSYSLNLCVCMSNKYSSI